MEQTLNKTQTTIKELTRQIVIAISFAFAYYFLIQLNPLAGLSGAANLSSFSSIRIANILHAFILVTPSAGVGIAMGAYAFNVESGKIIFGTYPIVSFLSLGVSLATYVIVCKIGRSTKTDLIILTLYGLTMGTVVSLNNAILAIGTQGTILSTLFTIGVLYKIITITIVYVAGYVFVKKFGGGLSVKNINAK